MSWTDRFCWTSRAELCDQLLQFLFITPPAPLREYDRRTPEEWNRLRVASLLGDVADASCVPGLCRLLLNPSEEQPVRIQTLYGLVRQDELPCLPLSDLAALLHDRELWEDPSLRPERHSCSDYGWLIPLLSLFRTEEATRLVRSVLAQWSARDRARLLRDLPSYGYEPDSSIVEWLFQRWWVHDRLKIETVQNDEEDPWPLNLRVALAYSERPEPHCLLREFWIQSSGEERPALVDELWMHMREAVSSLAIAPHERQELAERLALPLADLLKLHGPVRLMDRIEGSLRAASRAMAADHRPDSPAWWEEPGRALDFLAEWPDASVNSRIASLCACPDLHWLLRRELLEILWKRGSDLSLPLLRRAVEEPPLLPLARRLLPVMCRRPRREDREFFLWILDQEAHPVLFYHAVEALERLGEDDGSWRERLNRMTWSRDPYLRVRALGSLARRGAAASVPKLEQIARNARHVCVRAEAIRVLGELDAAQHLDLLRQALLEEHSRSSHFDLPAAEEAALALSRLGTPEALTALVCGYLTVPDQDLESWIGSWLSEADEQPLNQPRSPNHDCWGVCGLGVYHSHYRRWCDDEMEGDP